MTQNRYNKFTSNHLGEILKFRDDHLKFRNLSKKRLGSVVNFEKRSSPDIQSGRTLLDVILADTTGESKKSWRYFRNKFRLKRASAAWTSILRSEMQRSDSLSGSNLKLRRPSTRIPTSDPDLDSPSGRSRSGRFQKSISGLSDSSDNNVEESGLTPREDEEEEEGEKEQGHAKMSLMALLAETDREMGLESAYVMEDEEEEEVEEENDGGNAESGEYNNCCVCMVRHKGAAFIPCGHTFCRLCSRELYVQRGNCPLCNGYILEILDIF